MARMLQDRESTDRHLNTTKRHMRLCKQASGAAEFAEAIKNVYDALIAKQGITKEKDEERENTYDDILFFDADLDNGVRTLFEKCRQYDRDNPADRVLPKIFPEGKFTPVTTVSLKKEPDAVEQLAVRLESLGESHALYGIVAQLREKVEASRSAISRYHTAIRDQKIAEAEEEIAQSELRQQYEFNYLDARRKLGRVMADRLFPRTSTRQIAETEPAESTES